MLNRSTLIQLAFLSGLLPMPWEVLAQGGSAGVTPDAAVSSQRTGLGSCAATAAVGESGDALGTTGADGSDVIVANLQSTVSYPTPGSDTASLAVGTIICNVGTQRASWVSYTNQHPVISQNLFRLKDNRFEQIGMSWVSHGFYAVSDNFCGACLDPTDGTTLGVGCSHQLSPSFNGRQSNMSPRSLINPNTGYFVYPWNGPAPTPGSQERRLLVSKTDLDPALNPGARYFVEGHIVQPDDCRANTQDNNASYREVLVGNPSSGQFTLVIVPSVATQREQAGVRAWRDADPTVVETDIRVPGEGLFILAAKAWNTGTGVWRYSYALQNLNSDRAGGSFTIQLPSCAVITNVGFHDIAYHSGEPIVHDPWVLAIRDDSITWSTTGYDVDPNANALRYDTIYNFYFDANVGPDVTTCTIGLFKPGTPTEVAATTVGPRLGLVDCNHNNIHDACDLDCNVPCCQSSRCGQSADCNGNHVPDECEPDCNANGIADDCDITSCPPGELWCADCDDNGVPDGCEPDCNDNRIPDACDQMPDYDGDGVADCFDLCPLTTKPGGCVPPVVGCLYESVNVCIPFYPHYACIAQGGTPLCSVIDPGSCDATRCPKAFCRFGCLLGDSNGDGILDLRDYGAYQNCFSGSSTDPGFVAPPEDCLIFLDSDEDGDIDAGDYAAFQGVFLGP